MCESHILRSLAQRHSKSIFGFNIYLYNWECDMVIMSDSQLITEVEVKCTRWDFKQDAAKRKFKKMGTGFFKDQLPNYFSYACPAGLIKKEEVPHFAGLIYISESGECEVIKKPKVLHRIKPTNEAFIKLAKSCSGFLAKTLKVAFPIL
jgi:hypothetical protein